MKLTFLHDNNKALRGQLDQCNVLLLSPNFVVINSWCDSNNKGKRTLFRCKQRINLNLFVYDCLMTILPKSKAMPTHII